MNLRLLRVIVQRATQSSRNLASSHRTLASVALEPLQLTERGNRCFAREEVSAAAPQAISWVSMVSVGLDDSCRGCLASPYPECRAHMPCVGLSRSCLCTGFQWRPTVVSVCIFALILPQPQSLVTNPECRSQSDSQSLTTTGTPPSPSV